MPKDFVTPELLKALAEPFDSKLVSWRLAHAGDRTGLALCYIDARDVMNRFDEVCSPMNWARDQKDVCGVMLAGIGIKGPDGWVWKWDGAGETKFEPEKGSLSDSFKRAAVNWNVGRYLYAIPAMMVDVRWIKRGKKDVAEIEDHEYPRLAEIIANYGRPVKERAQAAAEKGMPTYKAFWNSLTDDQKAEIGIDLHNKLKEIAAAKKDGTATKKDGAHV
ncbi:MAG TPA: Rad52/Rad22 family DNA repair protein [Xanthobacteraceae bacterium]|nr:Rad52/Rad22 family DNA repair protein [Xanthobacteraceae bacterium]